MISNHSKRRKIAGDAPLHTATCPIYNLFPAGILKEVANFLEAPSRILFAIAVEPPSSPYDEILARCQPKLNRSLITRNLDCHTLDFSDIEKDLAVKLTDEDISKVLLHIDAAQKVKRLRLTNCTGITGACLAALRHSTSIEQIDMSLVEAHKNPELDPAPQLSCDRVLPILHSIISQERNSLKHLQFPHSWRDIEYADPQFVAFLNEYNQMMGDRDTTFCKKCNKNIPMGFCMETCGEENWFAIQEDTCSVCTNNICYDCKADDNHFEGVRLCRTCQRCYCSKCSTMVSCGDCERMYCVGCMYHNECANPVCARTFCDDCCSNFNCHLCGRSWCSGCMAPMANPVCCSSCDERCCAECSEKEGTNGVHSCDECIGIVGEYTLCDTCRVKKCKDVDDCNECCKTCLKLVSTLILKENKQLQNENKRLKEEVKDWEEHCKDIDRFWGIKGSY